MMNTRPPGSSNGPVEPRSVSWALRAAAFRGAQNAVRWRLGLRRMTELPKSNDVVDEPLPVATNRLPRASTAGPDGAQIAPSRCVGTRKLWSAPVGPLAGADTTQP